MTPAIFLIGLGPLARWKQANLPELAVRLRWAFGVSVITALEAPFFMGEWKPFVSFGLLMAFWVIASVVASLIHRLRSSGKEGLFAKLAAQSRSYYGMHAAHLGIAVFIIGVALVGGYETGKRRTYGHWRYGRSGRLHIPFQRREEGTRTELRGGYR